MPQIDRDLVYLYSENARSKIREIATLLKKSPQRVKYTISILEKNGLLHNPHTIFDYSYFGQILFRVYFKGGYISESDKATMINTLRDNSYLVSIYELSGEYDLVLELCSPNPSRFNKELRKIVTTIPSLNNYKIVLNVVTHIYPRAYLLKTQQPQHQVSTIIGGDREIESFDKYEMAVLKLLLENPKQRLTTLALGSGINIKTVMNVMKELQKRKILRGARYLIDHEQLGIYKFRLFLKLHNLSEEREATLLNYLLKTKEVVQVNKTVGDWNVEVDIETPDKMRMRAVISELRENFKDLIETFNSMEFYQYYKKSYLPRYLFQTP